MRPLLPTGILFVWTTCSPSLKDLGQANVGVPLGVNCLPNVDVPLGVNCLPNADVPLGVNCLPNADVPLGVNCLPNADVPLGVNCLQNVDVPLGVDCLPLLERGSVHVTRFGEGDCDYLIGNASRYLEFNRWALTGGKTD